MGAFYIHSVSSCIDVCRLTIYSLTRTSIHKCLYSIYSICLNPNQVLVGLNSCVFNIENEKKIDFKLNNVCLNDSVNILDVS